MTMRFVRTALALAALGLGPAAADPDLTVALGELRQDDWAGARAAMARIEDRAAADVVLWHLLRARQGSFAEAVAFLRRNPDWPGEPRLLARVEAGIPATTDPDALIAHFDAHPPTTARGTLLYATALRAAGRQEEAEALVIELWLTRVMPISSQAGFLEIFGDVLAPYHAARLDAMAWQGQTESAERVLPLVDGPEAALARARIALRDGRNGVDALIEAVPEDWRDHQGLAYERFRWRLDKGRRDEALEMLYAYDESADTLGDPEAWAPHRLRLARGLKQDGDPAGAYRVAARHHLEDGARSLAQLEWAGGLHRAAVPGPSRGRRRAFQALRRERRVPDLEGAAPCTGSAARSRRPATRRAPWPRGRDGGAYQTSFYGQLAAERAGLPADPRLTGDEAFPPLAETPIADASVLRAALALHDIGEDALAERFLAHMAETLPREQTGSLIAEILARDEPHIAPHRPPSAPRSRGTSCMRATSR